MAVIIILGITLWAVSAMTRALNDQRKARKLERLRAEQTRLRNEHNAMIRKQLAMEREQERARKEEERIAKEQAKQAAQLAKHEKRISDLETRMSQAEFDIQREIENIDHYSRKLANLDDDLRHAQWEVESWQKQRHLANAAKAEERANKIRDNIFSIENKVRMAEKRLDKAQRTHEQAARELSA